jgi:hypothetical protein
MTTRALVIASLLVAGSATAAHAQDSYGERDVFEVPRTEIGFGMLAGGYSVGPVSGAAAGIHLDAGRQFGRVKLFGEYNMLVIGNSGSATEAATRGLQHRGGANLRYDVGAIGGDGKPVQGTFWLEGGAGREWIYWQEGGRLTRDDISLGFGAQVNFQLKRYDTRPRVLGVYYAFKTTIAKAPGESQMGPATCGGPCDTPTKPSPYDLGVYFNLGIQFGR